MKTTSILFHLFFAFCLAHSLSLPLVLFPSMKKEQSSSCKKPPSAPDVSFVVRGPEISFSNGCVGCGCHSLHPKPNSFLPAATGLQTAQQQGGSGRPQACGTFLPSLSCWTKDRNTRTAGGRGEWDRKPGRKRRITLIHRRLPTIAHTLKDLERSLRNFTHVPWTIV